MTKFFRNMLLLCTLLSGSVFAQSAPQKPVEYAYFLVVGDIQTKDQVTALEPAIQHQPGVTFFQSRQFPPAFFTMKSSVPIEESTVRAWIASAGLKLTEYLQNKPENAAKVSDFMRRYSPQARKKP